MICFDLIVFLQESVFLLLALCVSSLCTRYLLRESLVKILFESPARFVLVFVCLFVVCLFLIENVRVVHYVGRCNCFHVLALNCRVAKFWSIVTSSVLGSRNYWSGDFPRFVFDFDGGQ
jgi:hypothetical protein